MMSDYPIVKETDSISSPGLWVDKEAVKRNISQMIADVGGKQHIDRLRPHIKTHKMREVVEMQVASGIKKCKAATPNEAKIAAEAGAKDILLAHQLVGPKIDQLAQLIIDFPETEFATVVDDLEGLAAISEKLANPEKPVSLWIDLDCGMHRSGIPLGNQLDKLQTKIESTAGLRFGGLHVYDGHLHAPSLDKRRESAQEIIQTVNDYLVNHPETAIVGGGTPTFGIWATGTEWECSPGTTLFWDCGYGDNYPDLKYEVAAGLITRVISKPGTDRICLDLGHKSVAAEMDLRLRAIFPEIDDYELIGQSEEHLVLKVPDSSTFSVGQTFTAIPRHICPTVALHAYATVLSGLKPTGERWQVAGRDRI